MSERHNSALANAITGLHTWMATHFRCATLADLQAMEVRLSRLIVVNQQPRRFIRLQVVEVRFVQPKKDTPMPDNLGVDVPADQFARITFAPYNEKNETAKLEGPLEAKVTDDSPTPADVVVGGKDGLTVDIKPAVEEGSIANVEVGGDADLDPLKREVLTTLVTVRRLGAVPGKAISLGGKPENVSFLPADQFGVFPDAPTAFRKR